MFLKLPGFLDEPTVNEILSTIGEMTWEDGLATSQASRQRKNNEQLTQATESAMPMIRQMAQAVMRNNRVGEWAVPKRIARVMYSRYTEGAHYGPHYDSALAGPGPGRADISFTVFLSEPAADDGGELVIESSFGEISVKEPAGTIVLYDTGLRHRVNAVTRGSRVVSVGWLESLVRSPDARDILFELSRVTRRAVAREPESEDVIQLRGVRAKLLRLWAET